VSRRRRRGDAEEKADIDLTPMLDVVFIMLIFFIVTASFVNEYGINVNKPDSPDTPPPVTEKADILVQVDANDDIYMEGRRVDVRSVRSIIARLFAENPKAAVIVKADKKANAGTYVAIADAARSANVQQISLVPDES